MYLVIHNIFINEIKQIKQGYINKSTCIKNVIILIIYTTQMMNNFEYNYNYMHFEHVQINGYIKVFLRFVAKDIMYKMYK